MILYRHDFIIYHCMFLIISLELFMFFNFEACHVHEVMPEFIDCHSFFEGF